MASASFLMAAWLLVSGAGEEQWRSVYLLSRSRVYRVTCGTKQGVGFLYRDQQHIITTLSVAGCGRTVYVYQFGGGPFVASMQAYQSKHDLALLYVKAPLEGPSFQSSAALWSLVGRSVAMIGHPYHPRGPVRDQLQKPLAWSIAVGVLGRVTKDYIQVNIDRVEGYEGAPVLDRQGRVVGMLTSFGPSNKPIGMVARASLFDALFANPSPRQGMPYLSWELHLQARFSFALGDVTKTKISPSNQEVKLDMILYDQWTIGLFVGFDLLSLRTDLSLSLLFGFSSNYRFLMPRVFRPYLNYIALEAGAMAMSIKIATSGIDKQDGTVFNKVGVESDFRFSFWAGMRFQSIIGQFSVGIFFDPESIMHPVLSVSWGL